MRPPVPYFGGKQKIAAQIVAAFATHHHYVEPFAGGLSVLLAKPRSRQETANDLDGALMGFWRVLRDRPEELIRACALTPHARAERAAARDLDGDVDEVELARRVFVALSQGRTSTLAPTPGWRHDVAVASTSLPRRLQGHVARLEGVAARLAGVSLECRPALDVVATYGRSPAALLYCDPPYLASSRGGAYRQEMGGREQHEALAEALHGCRATVVLSGYPTRLYDDLYAGWHRLDLSASTTQGGALGARTETLWSNHEFRYTRIVSGVGSNETAPACETCGRTLRRAPTGRPGRFCSGACRVAAHRARRARAGDQTDVPA